MRDVLIETRGGVQWITIDRPSQRNALNESVVRSIEEGLRDAMSKDEVRAIVLTGTGDKAFCAGADLSKDSVGGAFDLDFAQARHYVIDLFKVMEECLKPIICRVNGDALAGGLGLLCACDMAVATDDARVGTPESKVGMFPMMILGYMMRILPRRTLMEMCVTGEMFDANAALEMGLVNYVVPRSELDQKVEWLLSRIVDKSPTAVSLGKQAFHAMQDMSIREAFEFAQVMILVMSSTPDAEEGIRAFQEKRQPVWR